MRSLFGNLTVLDDYNAIRISNCGQAVSDDKAGSAFHQAQQ